VPHAMALGGVGGRAQLARLTLASAVALAVLLGTVTLRAADTPASPTRFVTDGAAFLSAPARQELEERLERYERDTGRQVLLWIGQTTGGEPIETWAVRAFAAWRVGRTGLDDGVVVFILAADRRVRIEVGYGLEDRLPDAIASRIIGDQMLPRLRAGDRDGAARAGVAGVLDAVGGEVGAPRPAAPPSRAPRDIDPVKLIVYGVIGLVVLGFIVTNPRLALMLLMTLDSHQRRGGGGWGGGGFGGGGGGWGGGGGGFSGGGGRSGGGGASGSW
jgi:uncharacterized protein